MTRSSRPDIAVCVRVAKRGAFETDQPRPGRAGKIAVTGPRQIVRGVRAFERSMLRTTPGLRDPQGGALEVQRAFDETGYRRAPARADILERVPVGLGKPVGFPAPGLGGARLVVLELRGIAAAQFDQLGVCLRFLGEALGV